MKRFVTCVIFLITFMIPIGITRAEVNTENIGLTSGVTAFLFETMSQPVIQEEEVEVVESTEEITETEVIDLSVENPLDPKKFKTLGIIKGWGYFTYTWYSERVLPGGGLKVPGRHHNSDGFVVDEDGYIVVASDDVAKGVVVLTPYGKGKIYDCGSGHGNLDLYVSW